MIMKNWSIKSVMKTMMFVFCISMLSSCSDDDDVVGMVVLYEYHGNTLYKTGDKKLYTHYKTLDRNADDRLGSTVETVEGDTVVDGKMCKVLKREFTPADGGMTVSSRAVVYEELINPVTFENKSFSQDGAKVYEYIDNQFILKYDFTLRSGDEITRYNVKTKQYEKTGMKMKLIEGFNWEIGDWSGAPTWRVTFDGSDCVWVESAGASYGDGMIYNPDEVGYKMLDSVVGADGTILFDYTSLKDKAIIKGTERPFGATFINDNGGWHLL